MRHHNYTTTTYSVAIEVDKSPKDVFNHIINDVPKYWPEDMEGTCNKLNDEFVFSMTDSHYSKNKVIELIPYKKTVWLVTDSIRKTDNYEWTGTKMIFELTPKGTGTQVTFTYDGIVVEGEQERLVQVCDMVIKENLCRFLTSFTTTIGIDKPVHHVFNCLKEVSKWWSIDFEGSSRQLGDEFTIHHPGTHYSKHKLVEMEEDKKIVWLITEGTLHWLQHDKHEWTNTKMIFELTKSGDKTVLHFMHEGLVPGKECYAACRQGWTMVIKERLFTYITTGRETKA